MGRPADGVMESNVQSPDGTATATSTFGPVVRGLKRYGGH